MDGFELIHISTDAQISAKLENISEFIQNALVTGGRVLVFDEGGCDRACTLLLAWMVYQVSLFVTDYYSPFPSELT